jgi:hypothetical protein
MKFFTREWASGELSDDDFESAADRYTQHLRELNLPSNVRALAATNLHDGQVKSVLYAPRELLVSLMTGDLQRGYFETTISYGDPVTWGATITLLEFAAAGADIEALEHELDRLEGRFVHSILFSSHEEAVITFSDVSVVHVPWDHRGGAPTSVV